MSEGAATWREAFLFAHAESMRAFDASANGETETARTLLDSAKEANSLARRIFESERGVA